MFTGSFVFYIIIYTCQEVPKTFAKLKKCMDTSFSLLKGHSTFHAKREPYVSSCLGARDFHAKRVLHLPSNQEVMNFPRKPSFTPYFPPVKGRMTFHAKQNLPEWKVVPWQGWNSFCVESRTLRGGRVEVDGFCSRRVTLKWSLYL